MNFKDLIKRKSTIGLILLAISLLLIMLGMYIFHSINNSNNENIVKTDIKPVTDRFPLIGNVDKCYWKARVISRESLLAPGPTSYAMSGYVVLEEDDFMKILRNYKWEDANKNFTPQFSIELTKNGVNKWMHSQEFDEYVITSKFVGKFYVEEQKRIVYFEIQQ